MTHIDADIATLLRDARWRIANKDTSTDEYKRKQSFNRSCNPSSPRSQPLTVPCIGPSSSRQT